MRKSHVLVVMLVLFACSFLISGCPPESLVSVNQEVQIGQESAREIESRYPVNRDPQLNSLVVGIGRELARHSDRQDIEYTFRILDLRDVNAVSLPGGWIYVYRGLISEANRDELAGVISHEIGHVAARHHADLIGRQTYAAILVGTLTRGDIQRLATLFANLQLLRWSRSHEFEADRLGILYVWRSQAYNPEGLITFFNRLLELQPRQPSEFEQMFQTHPVTSERITRGRDYLAELRSGQ